MKFIAPLLLFFLLTGNALVAQKDTSSLSSGVNLMGGAYFSAGDAVAGIQIGGELFFGWKKWQAEAQGFGKFRNDKPDYQHRMLSHGSEKTCRHRPVFFATWVPHHFSPGITLHFLFGQM
jgi:hypothetical protein